MKKQFWDLIFTFAVIICDFLHLVGGADWIITKLWHNNICQFTAKKAVGE